MKDKKTIWYYLVMIPSVAMFIALMAGVFLYIGIDNQEQLKFSLLLGFALSELIMILSAAGGVLYLLAPEKSRFWLIVNILLFFLAGFNGVFMFMIV